VVLKTGASLKLWIVILLVYACIASIIPVNIILQPRDYLATFILFFGLIFGYAGLILSRPAMHTPALVAWTGNKGPLFPMLFVFIACGAISGFHSLISTGTTSKQLNSEKDARKIGYGAMVLEGVLALLALLSVTAGLYWSGKGGVNTGLVYPELLKTGDWIGTFAAGYGQIVKPLLGAVFGTLIAIITLNAFVMTTLDSATRITRYLTEEFFAGGLKIKLFRNRYFSTFVIILPATYLALGNWKTIWPVFGASNQLVAALSLMVVSVWLLNQKKKIIYTVLPMIFMFVVTISALIYQIINFWKQENYLLSVISVLLVILAIFLIFEAKSAFLKKKTAV
jgi:carbon starvation protein